MATTDDRSKLDRILREMRQLGQGSVKVGVFAESKHKSSGQRRENGRFTAAETTPMAMIAAVHEYGEPTLNIPQRSVFRSWVNLKDKQIDQFKASLLRAVQEGRLTSVGALKRLGVFGKGGIKERILEIQEPALSDETIKAKGSSKPLVDTSQFLNSIQYQVIGLGEPK